MAGHALESDWEGELALEAVHVEAVDQIDCEDEGLCDGEGFQEVHRPPHLGDDLCENRGAAVGVDLFVTGS